MELDWEPLREIIQANERFVLTSHVRPDADAIGSELALAGLLEDLHKTVRIINASEMPPGLRFLDPAKRIGKLGHGVCVDEALDTDVHIVVDTSSWAQLDGMSDILRRTRARKVIIDHHISADDLGALEFKDTDAEATGALIFRMINALGYPVPGEIITPLFCAIATDTGWFRFPSTTAETMRIAARLIDLGAQPDILYKLLYDQFSLARMHLTGRALQRVTVDCNGRLAYTWVTQEDFKETGAKPVETEDLVNECLKIAGAQCAFIAIEQQNKMVKFSFRSRAEVDVAEVAEQFSGGGHKKAAGAMVPGPLHSALENVVPAMRAVVGP